MSSPVTPDQIKGTLPDPNSSICGNLIAALIRFPTLIYEFYAWAFDSSGNGSKALVNQSLPPGSVTMAACLLPEDGTRLLCLSGDALVRMEDGDLIPIKEIVRKRVDRRVMSVNRLTGQMEPDKIVGWMESKAQPREWQRLLTPHNRKRQVHKALTLTGNHPIWTPRGWVRTDDLRQSDYLFKEGTGLTDSGVSAIIGMYLGDGTCDQLTGRFTVSHTTPQRDYLEHTAAKFNRSVVKTSGYDAFTSRHFDRYSMSLHLRTMCPWLAPVLQRGVGHIRGIVDRLDELGMAYWYMDDGRLARDKRYPDYFRVHLHTEGLSPDELAVVSNHLGEKWGIGTSVFNRNNTEGKILGLDKEGSRKFLSMAAPFIHPSIRYKLPKCLANISYRDDLQFVREGIVPSEWTRKSLWSDYIMRHQHPLNYESKYDITTERNHNFLANGIVVHNCDGREVSRDAFPDLFAAIGTSYGTPSGSSVFKIPNLAAKFPVGIGSFAAAGTVAIGVPGGEDQHLLTAAESGLPAHTHDLTSYTLIAGTNFSAGGNNDRGGSVTGGVHGGAQPASQPHDIIPPYLGLYFYIVV